MKPNTTFIVHWDGELLPDITGKEHSDRLPVLVSGDRYRQLIGIPKIPSATGCNQAHAVETSLK